MVRVLAAMFSRKWLLTTVLVFAGTALCVRLGIWQLDRLEHRRAFNEHVTVVWSLPALDLSAGRSVDLTSMEYRDAFASGRYDFGYQVALRNQYYENQLGYHLLTPLLLDDGSAVLVDRGWIPADGNPSAQDWRKYDQSGDVRVEGILRLSQARSEIGGVSDPPLGPGETRRELWIMVDLERIGDQIPYAILPVYLQPDVEAGDVQPPIPYQPTIEVGEGPHIGYAGQWFSFAILLFFGYPFFYLRKQVLNP
jgi:surfeit locus 1 family protein